MLRSLRDAFRQAVVNFRTEMAGADRPDGLDPALLVLEHELVRIRDRRDRLRSDLVLIRREATDEERALDNCRRREELARGIGDHDTAEIARDSTGRHRRRLDVFLRKAEVLAEEIRECEEDLEELRRGFDEALRRDGL